MTEPTFPRLVADIGGTNARFGLVDAPDTHPDHIATMRCAEFEGAEAAAQAYLDQLAARRGQAVRPRQAAFALATAIEGDTVSMTNSDWVISRQRVTDALDLERMVLLNDFEALALSLPHLRPADTEPVGDSAPDPSLPMAVLGPGTGLGVAACIPCAGSWRALATEGGHASAGAEDDFEAGILHFARQRFDHVSAERLLSGPGLALLHEAICSMKGLRCETLSAEEITGRALDGSDTACSATVDTFCAMLGSFAGNVALTLGARGGVFLGGGIAPRLGKVLLRSQFRQRFESKGRFRDYLARIATLVIMDTTAALTGAARVLDQEPAS